MKFREHRGLLSESMETAVNLPATRLAICEHMNGLDRLGMIALTPTELLVEFHWKSDDRIGWAPIYIVSARGGVVGFTDGPTD